MILMLLILVTDEGVAVAVASTVCYVCIIASTQTYLAVTSVTFKNQKHWRFYEVEETKKIFKIFILWKCLSD